MLKAVIGVETIIFLLTLVAVSVAQEDVTIRAAQKLPTEYRDVSIKAIQEAGANGDELLKAIENCSEKHRKAWGFLFANMPERDITSLSADFILEDIDFTYKAIKTVPWGKDIPKDIFLNNILPYVNLRC